MKGDNVLCQNVRTKKWDRPGVIVEVGDYHQYLVKMRVVEYHYKIEDIFRN